MTDAAAAHDPGGKVKLPLMRGMKGGAVMSACGRYRTALWRSWPKVGPQWLWIGCNPSTAAADVDDTTIRRELFFTMRDGGGSYVKCNVMDYRATKPKAVHAAIKDGVSPCSPDNLEQIELHARQTALMGGKILCAWGALGGVEFPERTAAVVDLLKTLDVPLYCCGTTAGGHPLHPLYLPKIVKIVEYKP